MQVRQMTIEEVQKVIDRKNEEIRKLTSALVEANKANNYAYGALLTGKEGY